MRTLFLFTVLFSFLTSTQSAIKPLEIPEGITFSINMLATSPEDPPFLGPPVEVNTIEAERIQTASMIIDLGPLIMESVDAAGDAGAFEIEASQEGSLLSIQALRVAPAEMTGVTEFLEINIDNEELFDRGVGFGPLIIKEAEIVHPTDEVLDIIINNGSWMYITDVSYSFMFNLVDNNGDPAFTNYRFHLLGISDAPNLYEPGIELNRNEETGEIGILHYPELVFYEQDPETGCQVPIEEASPLIYFIRMAPPEGSRAFSALLEVEMTPNTLCGNNEQFFPEVTIQWPPDSAVQNWEAYN